MNNQTSLFIRIFNPIRLIYRQSQNLQRQGMQLCFLRVSLYVGATCSPRLTASQKETFVLQYHVSEN